ncbi:hypothetical protein BJX63DRAFT_428260 [Aspergillus granulosus]|uniref:Integral membrane protein n=1 Tax=Aspergillus granulosus TaxID=176169 RepID=A0ABR4HY69_9EURO
MQHLLLSFFLYFLACQGAWVRNFPCDPQFGIPQVPDTPFWIDSFHGALHTFDGSAALSLSILGVHNESQFMCDYLDLTNFEDHFGFQVLGMPVGRLEHFERQCPLPITDALVPPEGLLFSKYELTYSLFHAHRLQTLAAEISFKGHNGTDIACTWVKITPDIGKTASATITYIPAVITILVGVASYLKHVGDPGNNSLTAWAWTKQGLIWEIILDIASYLQYLQFIFLVGSLTMEYPGFYQPVVSQLAWASLLYWTGPINHGFTYTGIEDGMYVSNSSYGLEHMAQMLGYPQMPDIMLNASINLVILVSALAVISLAILLAIPDTKQVLVSAQVAGRLILAAVLSFFTLPLLSYMSYEFILIGYLPSYRITLVGLTMTFLVYLSYAVTSYFNSQRELGLGNMSSADSSGESHPTRLEKLGQALLHYLPHAIPLIQGIVIGGLQDWGLAQILVIGGCEAIVLISIVMQQRTRILGSMAAWCATVRLVAVMLSIAFVHPPSEAIRQWIGYLILCLHGGVIIFGYLVASLWKLYLALRKRNRSNHPNHTDPDDVSQEFPLRDIPPYLRPNTAKSYSNHSFQNLNLATIPSTIRPGLSSASYFTDFSDAENMITPFSSTPTGVKHYVTDFSVFYRSPRPSSSRRWVSETGSTVTDQSEAQGSINPILGSGSGSGSRPASSSSSASASNSTAESSRSILDELSELPSRPNVDYSTREVDSYYGHRRPVPATDNDKSNSTAALVPTPPLDEGQAHGLSNWAHKAAALMKPTKKEKGFQVVRPRRPT